MSHPDPSLPIVTHALKSLPEYFRAVWDGSKTFEIRCSDRGFKVGDYLLLQEWSAETQYTGRECWRRVTYITDFGQRDGYVVLAMVEADEP